MKDSSKRWLGVAVLLGFYLMLAMTSRVCADTYEYDDLNRLTKVIYDNGDYIEYGYDKAGNIVSVFSPDMPPVAVDDFATVTEDDSAMSIDALVNDMDIDGGPKSIVSVTQPSNGTVEITTDGAGLTYTPTSNYCNDGTPTDNFTYTLTPGDSTATVRVTVTCVNDVPVAGDDAHTIAEDTQLNIGTPGVLGNDSDVDGDTLTAALSTDVNKGTLTLTADGSFTYTPNPNYYGSDSFTYSVNDGLLSSDPATVTITVNPVNDAPVAGDDAYTINEDTPLNVDAPGLLGNDGDVDGDPLTAGLLTGPANGTLTLSDNGSFTYTPNHDFNGTDSFTYNVNDGQFDSNTATVNITVNPVNDPPVISADPISQTVQYSDGISPCNINISDIDSESLSISTSWMKDGTSPQNGLPDGCSLNTSNCTEGQPVSCTRDMSGKALGEAGTYDVTITVDDGEDTVSTVTTVIIEEEDARATFDGDNPVAVRVETPGGDSSSFDLIAYVREVVPDQAANEANPGVIELCDMSMTLVPVGPGGTVTGTCTADSVVGSGYDAIVPVTCSFDDVPVNTYITQVLIGGGYYEGGAEDVLTVYDPSLGFATGGGWFYWPGTSEKTNCGFTMKYNKKATKVQGSLLLIRHMPDGTIYRVKSNALYGLSLGEGGGFGWASFSGKCTYKEPGWLEPEGNYEFLVYVEDRDEPGSGIDRFWIEMKDKDGNVISVMSIPRDATDNAVSLNGGNIVVPHGGN